MTTTATYLVEGMTCGHCTSAVTTEVSKLAGVSQVAIDLATGEVVVSSNAELDDADVRVAVEEAGYEMKS